MDAYIHTNLHTHLGYMHSHTHTYCLYIINIHTYYMQAYSHTYTIHAILNQLNSCQTSRSLTLKPTANPLIDEQTEKKSNRI